MFGSIDLRVRPLRLGYLVNPADARQVREAIKLSTIVWGGTYNPIIPVFKRIPAAWHDKPVKGPSAQAVVQGYLEAFDPDILIQFVPDLPKTVQGKGLQILRPEQVWPRGEKRRDDLQPAIGIGVFDVLNEIFEQNYKFKRKYALKIVIPRIPKNSSLFWASLVGELPPDILDRLRKNYFEPLEAKEVDLDWPQIGGLMAGDTLFPRRISQYAVQQSHRSGRWREANVFFFDASDPTDVVDYWNLRALGGHILPVPKQFRQNKDLQALVAKFLRHYRRPWPHNPQHCDFASFIRSRHVEMKEMQEYASSLSLIPDKEDESADPFFSLQHWYPRMWDEWARDKDGAVPDDVFETEQSIDLGETDTLQIRLKPILPKLAEDTRYTGEPRCANEIAVRLYGTNEPPAEVFPKDAGEHTSRAISSITALRGEWRVGRNGLVILVKDTYSEHWEIPSGESVFFAWLRDRGWEPALSSSGLLAKQILRQLNGFILPLAEERLLGLLEHMNGGTTARDGSPAKVNRIDVERDLTVGELKNRLAAIEKGDRLYDYLLSRGLVRVGVRVQCPSCSRHSWYALRDVQDQLICPKCLNSFPAVRHVDSARWCYKTAGPFSVPKYADGAYAVLLALEFFSDHKMHGIRTTPAISFRATSRDGRDLEADFGVLWQETFAGEMLEGVLFGECKTYDQFGTKDFKRMRYLAKTFPGAVLAFCTLRKELSPKEAREITKIAKRGRRYWKSERTINPVLVLTGNELFSHMRPPYCWEAGIKDKFKHLYRLLDVCDATQQLYLGLPSWHVSWQEQWETRHQRIQQKKGLATQSAPLDGSV